jgi:hypothetical protein
VRRGGRALVLTALLAASAAACSDDGPGEGEARLEVDGTAVVERADGERETIEDDDTDLSQGDRVTMRSGFAAMRLSGGTTFELRDGVGDAAPTSVLMGSKPALEAGDLLVTTPETTTVEADGTEVLVRDGAARLSRAFGMSAAAYDADIELDSAGVSAEVAALREVVVPDLGRPRSPRPVDYEDDDPWDRRYLGAAMELGEELEAMADALTGLLPEGEGRTVGFLRLALPGLEDEEDLSADDIDLDRDPGDTLIGAAITDLGADGDFDERWGEVFGFRDDGADWGLVALDQEVRSEPLIGSVEEAFNASFEDLAQAPPPATPPSSSPTTPTTTPGGSDGGADGGADGGGGTGGTDDGGSGTPTDPTIPPTSPPTVEPPDPPELPEPPPPLEPVVEPVTGLVEGLLGGLLG